ncbi:MAG: TrkA C-terminal domain-containing protein, partial [Bacillota bacterium]|nr:TrkA C-terminal domain-containing protein [Bacillota bacterium]
DGDHAIIELSIPEQWHGKTIVQLDIRKKFGINILGIRENGKLNMNITPDTIFRQGTSILVSGNEKAVHKCFHI